MSPEVLLGQPFDGRADQYALAVTLFELISGRRAFPNSVPTAVIAEKVTKESPRLSDIRPDLPSGLVDSIARGMAKEQGSRFATCTEFADAVLAACLEPTQTVRTPGLRESASTEKPSVTHPCPSCGRQLRFRAKVAGKTIPCPACKTAVSVAADLTLRLPAVSSPATDFENSLRMKFRLIPAGEFMMGSPRDEKHRRKDEQLHRVRITRPFYLGVYVVTQSQWESLMRTVPWRDVYNGKNISDSPATNICWKHAIEFCRRLSEKEAREYRLPTEAEWEYACRAGTTSAYHFGADRSRLSEHAWYNDNAWEIGNKYAHRVGQKKPNPWGLFDMHGNVWEWCQDWYATFESSKLHIDPTGSPTQGTSRVVRGGGYLSLARYCRTASRSKLSPVFQSFYIGFRVALTVPGRIALE